MLKRKVAVVTGAAGEIGKACARDLLEMGCHVVVVDRSEAVCQVAQELGPEDSVSPFVFDLLVEQQIRKFGDDVVERIGPIDILVNNAGVHFKPEGRKYCLEEMPMQVWQDTLFVNLTAVFLLCQIAIPHMKRARWGRIINVSSAAGRTITRTSGGHYSASKAGMIALTRVLALECAQYNITANTVAPGPVETALTTTLEEVRQAKIAAMPLGRYGEGREIAAAVGFLASERASYMTGAIMDVNGGTFMP